MVDDRADLPNAIALNSSMVNGSRIIGPSVGGALIAAVGEGWCFLLDGISYIAVIGSLLAMRVTPRPLRENANPVLHELREGVRYVFGFPPIRSALLLLTVVSTMGMPYTVLMPDLAARALGGGSAMLGALMTASGVGALGGAFYLASRSTVLGLGRAIAIASSSFGIALVALGLSRSFLLSLAVLPLVGAGFMITMASTNTVLQTIVEEHLRGRVMAFYTMAFLGTAPIGSLIAGVVADRIGAPNTIMLGGVACLAGGIWFALRLPALRVLVRPIYVARGIIAVPDVDSGAKTM
jgi:predicted MFS family arabinose efflux permease